MNWRLSIVFAMALAATAHADPQRALSRRDAAIQILEEKAQLDAQTAGHVQDVVDRFRPEIKSARDERRAALREIKLILRNEKPAQSRIRAAEQRLETTNAHLRALDQKRMDALKAVTTPEQLGRVILSWRSVNRALRHNLTPASG
jgi:hypothetical protein